MSSIAPIARVPGISAPSVPAIVINSRPIPADILLLIFLEVFHSPPSFVALRNVIRKASLTMMETGDDPMSMCTIKKVCREFYDVVARCRELRSAVFIALPFYTRRLEPSKSHDIVKPWRLSHAAMCTAALETGQLIELGLFVSSKVGQSSQSKKKHTRKTLKPFLDCAESIIIHDFYACGGVRAFLGIYAPLVNVKRLALEHGYRPFEETPREELHQVLRLLPNLQSLTLWGVSYTEATKPYEVHFRELVVIDNPEMVREFLQGLTVTGPLSIHAQLKKSTLELHQALRDLETVAYSQVLALGKLATVTLSGLYSDALIILRPVLVYLEALEITESTLTQELWDCFNSEDFPHLTHLSLRRCSFTTDGLKSLYIREHNTIFCGVPFSFLTVMDCTLDGMQGLLLSWLKDRVERVQWHDAMTDYDHTRVISEDLAHAQPRPVRVAVSPPTAYDPDAYGDEGDEGDEDYGYGSDNEEE